MAKPSKHPSGVPDGTVVEMAIHPNEPNVEVKIVREVVVHEEDGKWHKEAGS